ncbi:MAG: triphosphoribosyl-dephospho-CoA synthase CitG, partial [Synergistales bacterium]|nr:triphosphoribosyl-dephospho-CoA synthase CitG [Synergistales bacterium]
TKNTKMMIMRNEGLGIRNGKELTPVSSFLTPASIGTLALEAMLIEVSVTPKPGLVDRNNSGAHKDMGFFTFIKSACALRSSFEEFSQAGENFCGTEIKNLFPVIRKIGIEAEKKMFAATGGINTHKGEIFSLGLLSACAGFLTKNKIPLTPENITKTAAKMCAGLCERDFAGVYEKDKKFLTKGERVYIEHGITGIRGEAEAGYPIVMNIALPALKKYLSQGKNLNDALVFTLINIMAEAHDTNIISRHDMDTAEQVRLHAKKILEDGINIEEIYKFDEELIKNYISPGGAGDLLAVTYFLYKI